MRTHARKMMAGVALASALALGGCGGEDCPAGSKMDCTLADGTAGQMVCRDGVFGACEKIAGLCSNGDKRACSTACGTGEEVCADGRWENCTAAKPSTEICDGLDNDCNGQVDETCDCVDGSEQTCSTDCGTGKEVCVKGIWKNCTAPQPLQEICDGQDNNCNGQIDEVCSCVHGRTEPCYEGHASTRNQGICHDGSRTCAAGVWGNCTGQVLPDAAESCSDTLDNNCNGTVNDGCACPTPGGVEACGTDEGACQKGNHTCTASGWTECTGGIAPTTESCNGTDDDCDGQIDEEIALEGAEPNNTCEAGTFVTVSDADTTSTTTLHYAVYPTGDVDYLQVTAADDAGLTDAAYCGWPWSNKKPTCHNFDLQLTGPAGAPNAFKASLMIDDCSSAPFDTTENSAHATGVVWHGKCRDTDSMSFWVKIEPTASSSVLSSCEPYELTLTHVSENYDCCTTVSCATDDDCSAEQWGCGGCDTSTGTCRPRCEVTECTADADCTAVGCGSCVSGLCAMP